MTLVDTSSTILTCKWNCIRNATCVAFMVNRDHNCYLLNDETRLSERQKTGDGTLYVMTKRCPIPGEIRYVVLSTYTHAYSRHTRIDCTNTPGHIQKARMKEVSRIFDSTAVSVTYVVQFVEDKIIYLVGSRIVVVIRDLWRIGSKVIIFSRWCQRPFWIWPTGGKCQHVLEGPGS